MKEILVKPAQRAVFEHAIRQNPIVQLVLERAPQLELPDWYLGAGCLTQSVWNLAHSFDPHAHIKDYDLVYYDPDTSYEAEDAYIKAAKELFSDINAEIEVRNEARVHIWYADHFGKAIEPYASIEDAIDSWPTTATSVGVRTRQDQLKLYAPYGLDDVLNLVVRPNKRLVTREVYEAKAARWAQSWPRLTVLPWDETEAN